MNEPKAKYEIVFQFDDLDCDIYCASIESVNWIRKEASKFGELDFVNAFRFRFSVYPNYDFEEVIGYLSSGYNVNVSH